LASLCEIEKLAKSGHGNLLPEFAAAQDFGGAGREAARVESGRSAGVIVATIVAKIGAKIK